MLADLPPFTTYLLLSLGGGSAIGLVLVVVFSAFLERPFFTLAGVRKCTLLCSLRANCLGMLVSMLALPVFCMSPTWLMVSYFATGLTKVWYLERRGASVRKGWIFAGTAISQGIVLSLPWFAVRINEYSTLQWKLARYADAAQLAGLGLGIVVFVVCVRPLPLPAIKSKRRGLP